MKLALAIGVVSLLLAWFLCAFSDYQRSQGRREKLFIFAGHVFLFSLMVAGALIGLGTMVALLFAVFFLRWMAAKRLAIRIFDSTGAGSQKNIQAR